MLLALRCAQRCRSEDRRSRPAREFVDTGGEHELLVEDIAAAAILEEPREFRGGEPLLGRADPSVVAAPRGLVDEGAPGNPDDEDRLLVTAGSGKADLPDFWTNRWVTVVRPHVDQPAFRRGNPIPRDSAHRPRIIHAEEERATVGVGERHEFTGEVLGVRRDHPVVSEADFLELRAAV